MKWIAGIRALALLRRLVRAQEEANRLTRERLELEFPAYALSQGKKSKPVRVVEFGTANVDDWNEAWRKEQGLE